MIQAGFLFALGVVLFVLLACNWRLFLWLGLVALVALGLLLAVLNLH